MARMIPPIPHAGTASTGELEVFRRLKHEPATDDWIVLHSLDVANHSRQLSGEIDFVIIIPAKGILCVEVKGCSNLRRSHGLWYYGVSSQPDSRGPFKQVATSMHSLRRALLAQQPSLAGVLCWTAVIFPYISFPIHSEEWHSWQVIDRTLFTDHPLSTLFMHILDEARNLVQSRPATHWFHPERAEPTSSQCRTIAEQLRPTFEFFESPRSRIQRHKDELKYYTAEQFAALDAMEANPRVMFCGPAGTGKTMLAIEAARRSCEQGRKVLLLCYNRLLGKWLEEEAAILHSQVVCKTLHSYMLTLSGLSGSGQDQQFWHSTLPRQAASYLAQIASEKQQFDELIVDEAQDVLRDGYLDVLDLSLRGGLSSGCWRFFGDFEKQMIYHTANLPLDQFLQNRAKQAPIYALRTNCRNTPRIAELVHLLGRLYPRYTKVLRPDNRAEPQLIYYSSSHHQKQLLLTTLEHLYAEGFSSNEIVILSPKSNATCIAGTIEGNPWQPRLQPLESTIHGQIGYCSIHAFKGLEAPIVIVTDIDRILEEADSLSLFYVAITRALHKLVIFMHEQVKKDIGAMLHLSPDKPL